MKNPRQRKRSDWRTAPRDDFWIRSYDSAGHRQHQDVVTFDESRRVYVREGVPVYEHAGQLQYLVAHYPRGYDYAPPEPAWQAGRIHRSGEDATSTPALRELIGENARLTTPSRLAAWKQAQEPRATHAEVAAAITRARQADPLAVAVLEWRQKIGPDRNLGTTAYMTKHGIASNGTLTRRLYKAVLLVFEELDRSRCQVGSKMASDLAGA